MNEDLNKQGSNCHPMEFENSKMKGHSLPQFWQDLVGVGGCIGLFKAIICHKDWNVEFGDKNYLDLTESQIEFYSSYGKRSSQFAMFH